MENILNLFIFQKSNFYLLEEKIDSKKRGFVKYNCMRERSSTDRGECFESRISIKIKWSARTCDHSAVTQTPWHSVLWQGWESLGLVTSRERQLVSSTRLLLSRIHCTVLVLSPDVKMTLDNTWARRIRRKEILFQALKLKGYWSTLVSPGTQP